MWPGGLESLYAFRKNLVVAASAGTGKTHALVGVIVHLLVGASELGGRQVGTAIEPSRVVATTFSRKAAAEIRARVVVELERLCAPFSEEGPRGYRESVRAALERGGLGPFDDAVVARRARRALDKLARAQIGTLHSFASTLVRGHSFELGLSPGFELVDEDEGRARVEAAIQTALESHLETDGATSRELVEIAGGVDRLVGDVARLLERLDEDGRGAADLGIDDGDARAIELEFSTLIEHARSLEGETKYRELASAVLDAHARKSETDLESSAASLCGVRASGSRDGPAGAFFEFRSCLQGDSNSDRGRVLVRRWAMRHRFGPAAASAKRLLVACEAELARRVRESSRLGFGDVLRAARDLLRDHPDVADEIASDFDVLLVDEVQDISRVQRDLIHLFWARGPDVRKKGKIPHVSELRPTGLFVVGDRKQSIYGFRGADVSIFAELAVGLCGARARGALAIPAGVAWEPEQPLADFAALRHNRRGEAPLLAFANRFSATRFRPSAPAPALYEVEYVADTEDLLVPPDAALPGAPEPRTTWLRVACPGAAPTRTDEALVVAREIRRIVEGGAPRVGKTKACPAWRDIAVLAQTNEMLEATAFALAQASVPYVIAGRGFYTAREVRDLAAILALVVDPGDKLAILEVLRGPWASVHDETLIGLTDPHQGLAPVGARWDEGERRQLVRAEDRAALVSVRAVVRELSRTVDRLGAAGVLREAVRALEFEETLILLPRGAQRVANVRKTIAIAERHGSARAMLTWMNEAADRELSEAEAATFSEEDDAVRLLTVHASKGLDFPIVFVPQVGATVASREKGTMRVRVGGGDQPSVLSVRLRDAAGDVQEPPSFVRAWGDAQRRDRAERQRLAYVAITRASDAMILVGDRKRPKSGETESYLSSTAATLAAMATDPETGTCLRVCSVEPQKEPARVVARPDAEVAPDPSLGLPTFRRLPIAPTSLQDFHHCPRRFQLVHLLNLPEHRPRPARAVAAGGGGDAGAASAAFDARAEGTLLHRVLERIDVSQFGSKTARAHISRALVREGVAESHGRHAVLSGRLARFLEGDYARRTADAGATILREYAFSLDAADASGRTLSLRGSIDLLVVWPDGAIDVLDYKRARGPSAEPYAFQLDVYALAAQDRFPASNVVRAGIVFLGGEASEPRFRPVGPPEEVRRLLASLGTDLVAARWTGRFARAAPGRCEEIVCGYVARCHPEPRGTEA